MEPARAHDEATAHNDARIARAADEKPTMQTEAKKAADALAKVVPDLVDWYGGMVELQHKPASELTTADLNRLNRLAGIVLAQVSGAQKATNEAMWISRRAFPEPGEG